MQSAGMAKTLLITGASGFLGWNLCALARDAWEVTGLVWRHPAAIPGASVVCGDLTRADDLARLFADLRPAAVVHAAAMAQPDACQRDPEASRRINVEAALTLAGLAADAGVPFVFTSTDLVFDGEHPPYCEADPAAPVSVYGVQKAAAERAIRARHPGALICRLPLMFGDPGPAAASFLQGWLAAIETGRDLSLFTDEVRTPVSGRTAARAILGFVGKGEGVLHLGGRSRLSRYDFGMLLAEILGVPAARIRPTRRGDVPTPAPRPRDVSLDSGKAYALGYDPPPLREDLRRVLVGLGHLPPDGGAGRRKGAGSDVSGAGG